ncbi:flagellar hook protein FlgE [Methylobacterium oryzisoli]|uniref:flagellar hook protein FlgE n=1 Tax=Methylobacterium oryzisoli TaxID=3385502 RepID=UPI00389122C6
MSLFGVLRTGVSGMNAQSNRIGTISENVQNSSTTGYKRTSTEFSSLLIEGSDSGVYNSGAVETVLRRSIGDDGPIAATTSNSDLAIQGKGFFVVQDGSNRPYLTRAGNFVVDGPTGNLVNAGGFTLMGYSLANGEPTPTLNTFDGLVPVNLASLGMQAKPSTQGEITGNLPADAPAIPAGTAPPAGTAYSKKTQLATYDPQGRKVILDVYLTKTAANTWSASIYDSANPASFPATPLAGSTALTFGADGRLTSAGTATITLGGRSVALDMSGVTQLAAAYDLKGQANGSAASAVKGTEFGSDGTVYAIYEDGSRVAAFKVPLGDVASPDNLTPRAGNVFEATPESGSVQVGFATAGGRGTIKSGALEQSNVDVSTELTAMIESQTVYTANSKVFMTSNEMLDTLMNLKR